MCNGLHLTQAQKQTMQTAAQDYGFVVDQLKSGYRNGEASAYKLSDQNYVTKQDFFTYYTDKAGLDRTKAEKLYNDLAGGDGMLQGCDIDTASNMRNANLAKTYTPTVTDVTPSHITATDVNNKKVFFQLMSEHESREKNVNGGDAAKAALCPDAAHYRLDDCGTPDDSFACMKAALTEHIKQHGTLDELVIAGHGAKERFTSDYYKDKMSIFGILNMLYTIEQETGIKVANKVTISGCSIFTNLSDESVAYYRQKADELNINLSSTLRITSAGYGGFSSDFAMFTYDGQVVKDTEHSQISFNPLFGIARILSETIVEPVILNVNDDWFTYHEGVSQEEGVRRRAEGEAYKQRLLEANDK
jgi:hypothetical protein